MSTIRLPAGAKCGECDAEVVEKVVIEGERTPLFPGAQSWHQPADRLGPNQPCGHTADAIVRYAE